MMILHGHFAEAIVTKVALKKNQTIKTSCFKIIITK